MTYISRTYALNLSRITRAEWRHLVGVQYFRHRRGAQPPSVAPNKPDIMDKLMKLAQRNCADLLARWRDPFDDRDYI